MYLVDVEDQSRESESIRRLLGNEFLAESLLSQMGLGKLSWIAVEVGNIHLVPSIDGEVDILAGPLALRNPVDFQQALGRQQTSRPDSHPSWHEYLAAKEIAESGGILWPPAPCYVVGVEVKCCYFSGRLHSTKGSPSKVKGIRKKIDRLEKMGVDRMAHLDVIANPPSDGANLNAWLRAAGRARESLELMDDILGARLPRGAAAGQFVWSVGAVVGGGESARGAGALRLVRPALPNPKLMAKDAEVLANREVLLSRISATLGTLPQPTFFPAMFAGCRTCRKVRLFHLPECDCSVSRG